MDTPNTALAGSEPVQTLEPVVAANTAANETPANTADLGSDPSGKEHQKLRQRAQSAEQDAAYWRGVAEGGQKKPQEPEQVRQPDGPPVADNFENYDDYLVAKAKHEFRTEQRQADKNSEAQKAKASYTVRFGKTLEKYPDLVEVTQSLVRNPAMSQNPAMAQAIMESEIGPEIAYHLGRNPAEATRIASMNPFAAAREVGKIEAKLAGIPKVEPQVISQAPEPIRAIGTKGTATVFDYEKSDINDFMKRRNTEAPPRRR